MKTNPSGNDMSEMHKLQTDTLTVSYSGVRGIVGQSLTEETARRFGRAFGMLLAERHSAATLLLARDTRPSGGWITQHMLDGLRPFIGRILDLGVVATPTLQFYLGESGAHGGAIVTASHNPAQWNGFKFFLSPENTVLDAKQTAELLRFSGEPAPPSSGGVDLPHEDHHERAVSGHVQRVLEQVDVAKIRQRRFKVAMDSGGGAGGEGLERLLAELGCDTVVVKAQRDSEPLPENLGELCRAVKEHGCDIGLAQDLDADRLALVNERGEPTGEEFTLVLVARHLLRRGADRPIVVVKNISTTRALDDVVAAAGARLVETRVGEVNLSRALDREGKAGNYVFGGEGNGGVIMPAVAYGRDSLIGTALVLETLATEAATLSSSIASLPQYHAFKEKIPRAADAALEELYQRIAAVFPEGAADYTDGLRIKFGQTSWLGIRPSNTEPILRLVAESREPEWPRQAAARIRQALG
jgi:phosphomannomutase